MVSQLDTFSRELKRVARDVGVDGKMGGQANVDNVQGRWKEITEDVYVTNTVKFDVLPGPY